MEKQAFWKYGNSVFWAKTDGQRCCLHC